MSTVFQTLGRALGYKWVPHYRYIKELTVVGYRETQKLLFKVFSKHHESRHDKIINSSCMELSKFYKKKIPLEMDRQGSRGTFQEEGIPGEGKFVSKKIESVNSERPLCRKRMLKRAVKSF